VQRGLQVIRFDNRDSGHSTHFSDAPTPNLPAALGGELTSASYTLSDMAADSIGLVDVLGLSAAHVVGALLGGAIAQTMAIEHPERPFPHVDDVHNRTCGPRLGSRSRRGRLRAARHRIDRIGRPDVSAEQAQSAGARHSRARRHDV
jgi:pimeloyl-ACP methyl ester carboxylesterase